MESSQNLRLASFDGGGVRGFSQLEIMNNIMHRLNWDNESDEPILPCDHFDLIGGSGTGGLIAVLLAKLRMSVDEVCEEFGIITKQVYEPVNLSASERTQRLRKCLEDALSKKDLPINLPLTTKTQAGRCASFVVASFCTDVQSTLCLRTYPVRSQPLSTITVIEAVLATCAMPPEFAPVSSGSGFRKRNYITATGAINPVQEVITEAHRLFGGEAKVVSLLSLGTGHPGVFSFPSAGGEAAMHKVMQKMMQNCEQRAQEVEQRIGRVGIYSRFSVEQGMQNDSPGQIDDPEWIMAQTEVYLTRHETGEKLDLLVENLGTQTAPVTLEELKHVGNSNKSNQIVASVEKSLGILISNQDDTIIAKLKPTDLEYGPQIAECMEGTRRNIFAKIDAWLADMNAPNILWVNGHPGAGKSAIAASVVEKWRPSGRLGSYFFFRRDQAKVMTPQALWLTVAYNLARRYTTIRKELVAALNTDESLPNTSNIETLFRELIHKPLMVGADVLTETPPIIVVDALDECGGLDGQYSDHRKGLIRTLKIWSTLPCSFKLIVTSRAEKDIEQLFSTVSHHPLEIHTGQNVDKLSSEDIRAFLIHELQQIASRYPSLPFDWPGEKVIEELMVRAAGLFIWPKTIIKLLERGEPKQTLALILAGSGAGGMAALYTWILNAAFPSPSEQDTQNFHSVLGTIIFSKVPLDGTSFARLLSIDGSVMEHICNGLQSVLDSGDTLRIHHQSFVDFLVNPEECPSIFLIDRQRENRNIALGCLKTMEKHLRFNICDLKSSYVRNHDVLDLVSRVSERIPSHLSYSTRFWASHLAETAFDEQLYGHIQYFMSSQFLFWLEALSLLKAVNVGSSTVQSLIDWLRKYHQDVSFAIDMQKFVINSAHVISQSTPHIYLSALPFAPRQLPVSMQYMKWYPQTLAIQGGGQSRWPAIQNVFHGHQKSINSVAFSPDGRRIVSGSSDKTIRVWDVETGETVVGPLEGHRDWIRSVSFSPDGKRIASGSNDKTIRIWDAATGEALAPPLEGHDKAVSSVVFFPTDERIVSGSFDGTVRIWDVKTGRTVMGPWKGHTDWVRTVCVSSDGRNIISGSDDMTIRVWDTETGETVVGPLSGHTSSVLSVSLSPDGRRIVSGSDDKTIRIWDVKMGKTVLEPWKGHTSRVNSVSFSPNGRLVISASGDRGIRIWDAETGETISDSLGGHDKSVGSVSFSPDGKRVVSGSDDNTIRIWDTEAGETKIESFKADSNWDKAFSLFPDGNIFVAGFERGNDWGKAVSLSPDGKFFVVGFENGNIELWDLEKREMVVGPLRNHHDQVNGISISPDGKRFISTSDHSIRVWDVDTRKMVFEAEQGQRKSVFFTPDSKRVISPTGGNRPRVWDLEIGEILMESLVSGVIMSAFCSPDSRRIICCLSNGTVVIWNADTGRKISERKWFRGASNVYRNHAIATSFSPHVIRIIFSSSDNAIQIEDAETGATVAGPLEGHTAFVSALSVSPDDRYIISVSHDSNTMSVSYDNTIRVWDMKTGRAALEPLEGHGYVDFVSFSPDSKRFVSISYGYTITVWDLMTGKTVMGPLEVALNWKNPSSLFSPDGKRIVFLSRDKVIRVWDLEVYPHIYSSFSDSSKTREGWILGPNFELLLWVPPEIRPKLCPLRNTLAIGKPSTILELKNFVHGEEWEQCKERPTADP